MLRSASKNMQIRNAGRAKGEEAESWVRALLKVSYFSSPWVFSLSREGRSLFRRGRFSSWINEMLQLSHERSRFTTSLKSHTPKAYIKCC